MKDYIIKNMIAQLATGIFISLGVFLTFSPGVASADQLPVARTFYREDGGVSIMYFVAEACIKGEIMKTCMDRSMGESDLKDLPYDDVTYDQIPTDRSTRDQWRGKKGRGIWVDETLRTKAIEMANLDAQLDEELIKAEPNPSRVLKLQSLKEKLKEIDRTVLTDEDLAMLEQKRESLFGGAMRAVGRFFASVGGAIRDTALALTSLVTESLSIGSPSAPAGITIYDQNTGEPFCVVVKDGQLQNIPGECTAATEGPSQSAENPGGGNGNGNGGGDQGSEPEPTPAEPTVPGVEISDEVDVQIRSPEAPAPPTE